MHLFLEAAALADRTDALTKRPLDFDLEEETRKTETNKWLESHFGSESSARSSTDESRDDDVAIEPTKKTYFNVTIKSSPSTTPSPQLIDPTPVVTSSFVPTSKLLSTPSSKLIQSEREGNKKYFQGITEWSERREPLPAKPLATKEFQEKLAGTLQRNRLMEDIRSAPKLSKTSKIIEDDYATVNKPVNGIRTVKLNNENSTRNWCGSKNDIRYKSTDEVDNVKREPLTRYDSGYIRGSREDLRPHRNGRENSFIRDQVEEITPISSKIPIQRDDSAYVSSSTHFTAPRSPRRGRSPINRTPDSGIKSPSPPGSKTNNNILFPSVPERKKMFEKRMSNGGPHEEPPPDYSPPPRSRSHSPVVVAHTNGYRKPVQKARFSESVPRSNGKRPAPQPPKPVMPAQTQTEPEMLKEKKKSSIGSSLKKLVGKIRSASAERKLRLKSKTRSPSPSRKEQRNSNGQPTYQQYNVIDGHIGNGHHNTIQHQQQVNGNSGDTHAGTASPVYKAQIQINDNKNSHRDNSQPEVNVGAATTTTTSTSTNVKKHDQTVKRRGSSDLDVNSQRSVRSGSQHKDNSMITSPKQRFYLGENPYTGSIFGKENKYDGTKPQRNYSRNRRSEEPSHYQTR